MINNVSVLNKDDNVAVALCNFKTGNTANYSIEGKSFLVEIIEDIPIYHKVSIANIKNGTQVYKYGQPIGRTTCDISLGQHVHSHNLVSIREYIIPQEASK